MKTNEAGIEIIKHFESLRLEAYLDGGDKGIPTIGYGSTRGVRLGDVITEAQAEELFKKDLSYEEYWVKKLITRELNENQFSALASFTFNVGSGNLQASTLRTRLNRDGVEDLIGEFMRWHFHNGKKSRGLLRRRIAEAELFYA
jgi:lysozyme